MTPLPRSSEIWEELGQGKWCGLGVGVVGPGKGPVMGVAMGGVLGLVAED